MSCDFDTVIQIILRQVSISTRLVEPFFDLCPRKSVED